MVKEMYLLNSNYADVLKNEYALARDSVRVVLISRYTKAQLYLVNVFVNPNRVMFIGNSWTPGKPPPPPGLPRTTRTLPVPLSD